jgi:hypothetical protein
LRQKIKKKSLLGGNFFPEIRLYGFLKIKIVMLTLDLKELLRKNIAKKDNPEKLFFSTSAQKMFFLGLTLFGTFFLNNFFRSEIKLDLWTLRSTYSRKKILLLEGAFFIC